MRITVIGDGGHGKVVRDLIRLLPEVELAAVLDDRYAYGAAGEDGLYRGPAAECRMLLEREPDMRFIVAVGGNRIRKALAERWLTDARPCPPLIHPAAVVSKDAALGAGAVVMARAVVQAGADVGAHAIVNTGAIVEHDCHVGAYAHICPSATLTGAVTAGEGAMIGAGAVVIPGREVGDWAVVGAGAVVIRYVPPMRTAVGVPAAVIAR